MKKYLIALICTCISLNVLATTSEILQTSQSSWNKNPIKKMVLNNPEITVVRIQIPKGEKLPLHKHPILNVGYLTKGELTVYTEKGETLVLKTGDSIVEVIDTWHYGESTGKEDAEIVVVYVGNKGDTITESKK